MTSGRGAAAGAALAAWLAACCVFAADQAAAAVTVTDDRGRAVTFMQPARRVVSLSPALTEAVCALGACARLVGTDRHSNWPADVQRLPKLGGLDDASIEAVVALKPDLVLAAVSTRAVERLESLGLQVLALEPRQLAEVQRTFVAVAAALGDPGAAERAWRTLSQRIDAAVLQVPPRWRGKSAYFEVASVPYAAGEASFVGELVARFGLVNIVPASMGPFPQLNPEFVLRARPAVVMAAAAAVAEMPRRPGWSTLQALQQRHTCAFTPEQNDTLMRAGPRLADAAETLAGCLAKLPPPPG